MIRKGRGSRAVGQVHHPTAAHQLLQLLWMVQLTLLPLLQTSSVKSDQEHPVSNCYKILSTDFCLVRTTLTSLYIPHIQPSPKLPLSRTKTPMLHCTDLRWFPSKRTRNKKRGSPCLFSCHNTDKYLTIILRNRAEYRLILSRWGRRPSRLKSDDIPWDWAR